jgi:hypothetical protein
MRAQESRGQIAPQTHGIDVPGGDLDRNHDHAPVSSGENFFTRA